MRSSRAQAPAALLLAGLCACVVAAVAGWVAPGLLTVGYGLLLVSVYLAGGFPPGAYTQLGPMLLAAGARRPLARAWTEAAVRARTRGDHAEAAAAFDRAAGIHRGLGDAAEFAACLLTAAVELRRVGGHAEAEVRCSAALDVAETAGLDGLIGDALVERALLAALAGDLDEAAQRCAAGRSLARSRGIPELEPRFLLCMAEIAGRSGDAAGAVAHATEALQLVEAGVAPHALPDVLLCLADAELQWSWYERAREHAERCLRDGTSAAPGDRVEAALLLCLCDLAELGEAAALARLDGIGPTPATRSGRERLAQVLVAAGAAAERRGDPAQAMGRYQRARALFAEISRPAAVASLEARLDHLPRRPALAS